MGDGRGTESSIRTPSPWQVSLAQRKRLFQPVWESRRHKTHALQSFPLRETGQGPRGLETHVGNILHSGVPSPDHICAHQLKLLLFSVPRPQPRMCQKLRPGPWDVDTEEMRLAKTCLQWFFPSKASFLSGGAQAPGVCRGHSGVHEKQSAMAKRQVK